MLDGGTDRNYCTAGEVRWLWPIAYYLASGGLIGCTLYFGGTDLIEEGLYNVTLVNLYIIYISNKEATQYFSLILEATLQLSLIFGPLFY